MMMTVDADLQQENHAQLMNALLDFEQDYRRKKGKPCKDFLMVIPKVLEPLLGEKPDFSHDDIRVKAIYAPLPTDQDNQGGYIEIYELRDHGWVQSYFKAIPQAIVGILRLTGLLRSPNK